MTETDIEMTDIESDDLGCFIEPESLEMALEFSKRYTRLLLNRKNVNADIKELKKEFNEQGLPTNVVVKAFSLLRNEKKEDHRSEIEGFKEYIQKNNELLNLIKELDSKES